MSAHFAAAVRAQMAAALPGFRYRSTTGGAGPLVAFDRPAPKQPLLREQILFQKGLHGASWFRVNLTPLFDGDAAGGRRMTHSLWEGATLGPDVRWKRPEELRVQVERACAALDPKAKRFFARFEKSYAAYKRLFGSLVTRYAAWFAKEGGALPLADFFFDDDDEVPAFDRFFAFLKKKMLTKGVSGDVRTCVWRFWHFGRPMREVDYRRGEDYTCSRCGAFASRSRSRLVKKRDPAFGTCFLFVCSKHS